MPHDLSGARPGGCIGLDLDNTLVDYGDLFYRAARALTLLDATAPRDKTALRDLLRSLPDGETQWRRVQAHVYGPGMAQAKPYPGVAAFLEACARAGLRCVVISHKTPFAAQAPHGPNLHEVSRAWLRAQGFMGPGRPLREEDVFFEPTRAEKTARIRQQGCGIFVDDLPEVFADPGFPPQTAQALFSPSGQRPEGFQGAVCADWAALRRLALGEGA